MRHKSSASWAVGVVAPWCLGVGLIVSFTASAGQDPAAFSRKAPLAARVEASVVGTSLASTLYGDVSRDRPTAAPIQLARLDVGGPYDLHAATDEREPHDELKPNATGVPEVDRSHKGDPLVAMLRPSYESRRAGQAKKGEASATSEEPQLTTQRTASAALPVQAGSTATPGAAAAAPQVLKERALHGATPAIPRAVALGSSTPSQPDAVPIEVASFPHITLGPMAAVAPGQRPNYASLIDPEKMSSEKRCLAEAVYFEARSEPVEGQAAVAQVVLNRVSSGLYPPSICGVVYQGRRHYMGCQFSFACEGKSLRITEAESWATAVRVADEVLAGQTYLSQVGRSTHYHADYVRPYWARTLTRMEKIGHHVFYKIKGQS
ncbi:MAG: cell wall hydrolase [Methylocystis sp.]